MTGPQIMMRRLWKAHLDGRWAHQHGIARDNHSYKNKHTSEDYRLAWQAGWDEEARGLPPDDNPLPHR